MLHWPTSRPLYQHGGIQLLTTPCLELLRIDRYEYELWKAYIPKKLCLIVSQRGSHGYIQTCDFIELVMWWKCTACYCRPFAVQVELGLYRSICHWADCQPNSECPRQQTTGFIAIGIPKITYKRLHARRGWTRFSLFTDPFDRLCVTFVTPPPPTHTHVT
jgi:hypothetical protein